MRAPNALKVVLADYGAGNLRSVCSALVRAGARPVVSGDPAAVEEAQLAVVAGVGNTGSAARGLHDRGLAAALLERVEAGRPVLGICVGMQLMASRGLEHRETRGFGWIPGDVVRLAPSDPALKVPHMGWNDLVIDAGHSLLDGIRPGDHAYFVHSYHLRTADPTMRLAHVDYGEAVTAVVARGNVAGTQFHPEKSQATGLRLIANFLRWRP